VTWRAKYAWPYRKTPIIGVTANAMKGDREICIAAGMDDYVPKPVKLELLLDVIDKWISHSRGCDRDALVGRRKLKRIDTRVESCEKQGINTLFLPECGQ